MQFFEHQDQARGRTTLLLFLYVLALTGLVAASSALTHYVLTLGSLPNEELPPNHWKHVFGAGGLTLGVIVLGSAFRLFQLRGGGVKVAETLGGTLASGAAQDLLERRAVNIVEEMAIASGLPVPPVYILRKELGINAFAAGWSPDDAIIGLTQGALENLSRDQLQGVVAHEFSHILNRDCALNMRLMGILHGIVLISVIGRVLLQFGSASRGSRREGGQAHFLIAGAGIWLFGSLGVLLARIIQSAVSRQREYLADASAVQFTRNPAGIGGALATIGSQTSALISPRGAETSHMLLGEHTAQNFLSILASHPPLFDRIQRILPSWNGVFAEIATPPGSVRKALERRENSNAQAGSEGVNAQDLLLGGGLAPALGEALPIEAASILTPLLLDEVLQEPARPLTGAAALLALIPPPLRRAAEEPFSSRALICAWVLDPNEDERAVQLAVFGSDAPLREESMRLYALMPTLDPLALLPLFDIAVGTLAALSDPQKKQFAEVLHTLKAQLATDSYRNFCLASLALRHLNSIHTKKKLRKVLIKNAIENILGVLATQGHDTDEAAVHSFRAGTQELGKRGNKLQIPSPERLTVQAFEASLETLTHLPMSTRTEVLSAAELIAANDGELRPEEAELLRAMASFMGVATRPVFASP